MQNICKIIRIAWASPWTLLGLLGGLVGLLTGGRAQRTGCVIEFYGGFIVSLLKRAPVIGGASAITFGHTVLARTLADLDATRAHEAVHVAQYERWGPLFIPAYLGCSVWLWLRGKHPYWDNPFEQEAYGKSE